MGAFKILKKSVQNFNYDNVLYSNKVGRYSLVVYKMSFESLLVLAENDKLLMSSIQSDIVEYDMDLLSIKNNKDLPKSLKLDFLSKSYEISSKLEEVWQK